MGINARERENARSFNFTAPYKGLSTEKKTLKEGLSLIY